MHPFDLNEIAIHVSRQESMKKYGGRPSYTLRHTPNPSEVRIPRLRPRSAITKLKAGARFSQHLLRPLSQSLAVVTLSSAALA